MKIISHNAEETKKFAGQLAKTFKGGDIIGLHGDLGSGKTSFVQGLAEGLGVKEKVNSPTFILMKIYPVRFELSRKEPKQKAKSKIKKLIHLDAYRLRNFKEFQDIGVDEYLNCPDSLVVIEWVEKVAQVKKKPNYQEIGFAFGKKTNERIITLLK